MYFTTVQIISKAILALSIGIFGLLVGIDNILDYATNYQFVTHVLSMDAMESFFSNSPVLLKRAITSPFIHKLFYNLIITEEIAVGILFTAGSVIMFVSIFNKADIILGKTLCIIGATIALLIWYFDFAVIGGEYFSMWANKFNGQDKAYTFSTFILLSTIYILIKEYKTKKAGKKF